MAPNTDQKGKEMQVYIYIATNLSCKMEKNVAYCIAKFAAAHRSSFCCNKYLLPAAVVDACRKDTSYVYLV